jgi:hypothetical protein
VSLSEHIRSDDGDEVERTEATWQSSMSRATYVRLLRLLFDPMPDDGGIETCGVRVT